MTGHSYFTRSKNSKGSFPDQSLSKGKEKMTESSEGNGLTEVIVTDPAIAEQNKLIAQLLQQISEMRAEMQKNQDSVNLAIAAKNHAPDDEGPPLHFPPPNSTTDHTIPPQKAPIIGLTPPNFHHACTSHQTPPPLQSLNSHNPQIYPLAYQNPDPNIRNPPTTQPTSPKAIFHTPTVSEETYLPFITYSELDPYKEKEKEWRAQKEIIESGMRKETTEAIQGLYHVPSTAGLDYEDLNIRLDLDIPEGFKVPEFDTFSGDGNPLVHLRVYRDQLVGVEKNEAMMIRLFSQSLSGEALDWFASQGMKWWSSWNALADAFIERFCYNIEIVPDRYSLEKIKQKSTESYREYAYRWRKEAAKVRPPMTEQEISEAFLRIQEPDYFDKMLPLIGAKFIEIVKVGEAIEYGLETGKIARIATRTKLSVPLRRKRKDVSSVSSELKSKHVKFDNPSHSLSNAYHKAPQNLYPVFPVQSNFQASNYQNIPSNVQAPWPNYQNISPNVQAPWLNYQNIPPSYQTPLLNYQNIPPSYQAPQYPKFQMQAPTLQNPPSYCQVPLSSRSSRNVSRPSLVKRTPRVFTPLVESQTQLYERLKAAGVLHPIEGRPADPSRKFYKADQKCAYHSGAIGHTTENCINLKHKIQDLIDQKVVTLQTVTPSVNSNPLPLHQQVTTNTMEVNKDWRVDKAIMPANFDRGEKIIASPSKTKTSEYVIMIPHQAPALMLEKGNEVEHIMSKSLPHLPQSLPVQNHDEDNGLGKGI